MYRLLTFLLFISVFLLAGCCPRQPVIPAQPVQTLVPIYRSNLPDLATQFAFSEDGKSFILAGNYGFVYLYDAESLQIRLMQHGSINELSIRGIGYIDNNTWYLATSKSIFIDDKYTSVTYFSIRQVKEPEREIHQYWFPIVAGKTKMAVNDGYIAYGETMLDWRTGRRHTVETPGEVIVSYVLTKNNQVVSRSEKGSLYLFSDPIKQQSQLVDIGYRYGISSPDAQYALSASKLDGCKLLQLPQNKLIGSCKQWGKKLGQGAFSPDSQLFAVSAGNEAFIYSTQPFKRLMSVEMPKEVRKLKLSEGRLAVEDNFGNIEVWGIAEKNCLEHIQ